MKTSTKVIIAILIVVITLILAAVVFVGVLLSRINRVSVEEQTTLVQQQQEEYQQAIDEGRIEAEEKLEDSELDLKKEVEQTQLSKEDLEALAEQEKRAGAINVLLIGVDRRGTNGLSRSDTMMIATLDVKNKRLKLTSLMRDMYVPIPGYGENRINSACATGGPGLVMQTINENFEMDLEKYVLVDFKMFEKIVDKLGGITINLSAGEVAEANDCIAGLNKQRGDDLEDGFITKEKGDIRLTGKQALGYARIRHFGNGDYARTSRQAKVLQAIFSKFVDAGAVKQTQILYDVLPLVETNIESTEILSLATRVLSVGTTEIMHYRLPVEDYYKAKTVRGMSVLLPDIPMNAQKLHWFIYEATEVEALPGSNTKAGTYHPKATPTPTAQYLTDENGALILDADGNPIPIDPASQESGTLAEETPSLPEESDLPEESPLPDDQNIPDEDGEDFITLE